jgi:VWFA-related protein
MLRAVRDAAATIARFGLLLAVMVTVGVSAQPPAATPPLATPPAATQPPAPTPTTPVFRSGIDLVELDLRVADGRGAPITDLTAADVEVRENGVLQRVEDLMRVSLPLPAPASTRPPAGAEDVAANYGAGDARVYVIVLDDLHVDGRRTLDTRRLARAIVDRIVGPNDQAAVLYASGRTDAAQPFTSSHARLYQAIDFFVGRKLRSATLERQEVYNQFFRGNRGRPRPEDLRDTADQERSANARAALQTLATATSILGRIEGRRKAVILLSQGLDYDISGLSSQTGSPSSGISMTPGPVMTGLDGGAIGRALGQVVGLASRANVTFYTVDPRAGDVSDDVAQLHAPPEDPSLRISTQAILSEKLDAQTTLHGLAAQTGGAAFLAPGDVDRFDRIARESSEYYLLRYYPTEPLVRGEFREVSVSVKRADARVSARRGYFARPAGSARAVFSAPDISPALGAALASPLPADGLPLRVHATPLRGDRSTAQVAVTTQAPGAVLTSGLTTDRLETTLEVGVVAIEAGTGAQSGSSSLVGVIVEGPTLAMLRGGDYRVVTRLPLAPGRYQLRVGVRDRRTDRLGVATIDLVVPDFRERKPMLSGLMLTSKVASAAPTASDAETARLLPVLPSAVRRFTTADELLVGIEAYGAERGGDAITLRTSLEDAQGRRVVEASTAASSGASSAPVDRNGVQGTRHVWPLSLQDVPPGRYVLAAELWRNDRKTPLARRETIVFVSGGVTSTR